MSSPLKTLAAMVLSLAIAVAVAGCGGGSTQCGGILEACADAGPSGGGNGGSGGNGGNAPADAGSPMNCGQLQNCFNGCAQLSTQTQQQGCVTTCEAGAYPASLQVSQAMWSCIQTNDCQTTACVQQSCPSQLMACQTDTGMASAGGGSLPAALVGEWDRGSVSTVGFYNPGTGAWGNPGGTGSAYHFNADGSYTYAGLLSAGGTCGLTDFFWEEGTATVVNGAQGSQLVLVQTVNTLRETDGCGTDTTTQQTPSTHTLGVSVNAADTVLSLTDPDPNIGTLTYQKQ
jgi:hypothetical protein